MSGGIFLLQKDGQLVEMGEQPYDSEELLQQLLAEYPSLLAGSQMDTEKPRRWLLISREAGLASDGDGPDRWSVDHLFLDQDGIPTLVEVKRSSDTRIRREVVGQMLDYAANAVLYWPAEEIRAKYASRCEKEGKNPARDLESFLCNELQPEKFWSQVKTNLQAGKLRLVFVADEIPNELRRIVEFLNQQMEFAEVLAVEIRQFAGQGLRTLVPRVMGQTAESERAKSSGNNRAARQWDEASFFAELEKTQDSAGVEVARRLLDWTKLKTEIWWGRGGRMGSFTPIVTHGNAWTAVFTVWTYGKVEVNFQYLKDKIPFKSESRRLELLGRLNSIPGIAIDREAISGRPGIPFTALKELSSTQAFLGVFDWVMEELKLTTQQE